MKKISIFIITAAVLAALFSCEGINTASGSITMDFSSILEKSVTSSADTARVWVVPDGMNSFYDLNPAEEAIVYFETALTDTADGASFTIEGIPAGISYDVYVTLGATDSDGLFTALQTANSTAPVYVAGTGSSTGVLTAQTAVASQVTTMTGKDIVGVVYTNSTLFAADSATLYYGASTANLTGYSFNSITEGKYWDGASTKPAVFISTDTSSAGTRNGIIAYDTVAHSMHTSFSDGINSTLISSSTFSVIDTNIFDLAPDTHEVFISQLDAGIMINYYDYSNGNSYWSSVDLSDLVSDLGITLEGRLVRDMLVVDIDGSNGWVYFLSKAGNYRVNVSYETGPSDTETYSDYFPKPPVSTEATMYEKRIYSIEETGGTLYFGTSDGIWTADVGTDEALENQQQIAADEIKVTMMAVNSSGTFLACVTPLELLIIDLGSSAYYTAAVPFNSALPVTDYLYGDEVGITGLEWEGNTLYISGDYGVSSISDVSTIF